MPGSGTRQTPWLVLPSYNEAENLRQVVSAVLAKLLESGRVLIVDDNSPDGTGKITDDFAAREERVEVLHRKRKTSLRCRSSFESASSATPRWAAR
ncbi:MAG TPA: glycosyltransferase [Solirubrobacterales bacterium]|nr:glycosyltransferase [Solirubrobacterales bacterium]